MRASTTQDTGEASPVTGALAFTVVFCAACVPPFGWTFVMPAVGVEGVVPTPVPLPVPLPDPVPLPPVLPLLEDAVIVKFVHAVPP